MKPTKGDARIVNDLVEAARTSGWEDDQGTGRAVDAAKAAQEHQRKRVLALITRLRRKVAALQEGGRR